MAQRLPGFAVVEGGSDRLVVVPAEEARAKRGLDVRLSTQVTRLDHEARRATLSTPEGERELGYDQVVLAVGASPRLPARMSAGPDVFVLRHLDDGVAAMEFLRTQRPRRAVVVGGGFVGLEMAEAFVARGLSTTLVHSRPTLLSGLLDADLGKRVNEAAAAAGVDLVLGRRVESVEAGRPISVGAGGETLDADVVAVGIGAVPNTELAESVGCRLGDSGAVRVSGRMETGVDGVWACGDSVELPHRVARRGVFLPLALHANRTGRIVGQNVTGGSSEFPGVLGTTITRFQDLEAAATGLSLEAAVAAGFHARATTIDSGSKAHYFPGSAKVSARLVVATGSERLLGAQIVGGPQTAKRIDAMSAAVWMGATASDVEAMDFAYAPPFNPVWDPWAIAARLAGRTA